MMPHYPKSSVKEVFHVTDVPIIEAHCFEHQDFSLLKPFELKFEKLHSTSLF